MPSTLKVITTHDFTKLLDQPHRDEANNLIIQDVYIYNGTVVEVNGQFYQIIKPEVPEEVK